MLYVPIRSVQPSRNSCTMSSYVIRSYTFHATLSQFLPIVIRSYTFRIRSVYVLHPNWKILWNSYTFLYVPCNPLAIMWNCDPFHLRSPSKAPGSLSRVWYTFLYVPYTFLYVPDGFAFFRSWRQAQTLPKYCTWYFTLLDYPECIASRKGRVLLCATVVVRANHFLSCHTQSVLSLPIII